MGPLRIAVVGCGYWGPNLIRNFASSAAFELAWVCDLDPARLDGVSRRYRVGHTTTRFEDLLEDPTLDAVALATPVSTHRPLGERVLAAGKHLWVEKPLAGSVEDAEALVRAAEAGGRRLFVDHTFIYTPAVRKMREMIAAGDLGEILYFDSVRVNLGLFQADTNVLWDLGPHDVSIAHHLLGQSPTSVSAIGVRHVEGSHENMAYLTLRYPGSLIAHFHFNWLAPVKIRLTLVGGSRRMLVFDDIETSEKIKVYDKGIDVKAGDLETRRRTLISYRTGDMWSPRLDTTEALALAAADFAEAITHDRPPLSGGPEGLEVVRTLAAAERSLASNGAFVTP